MNFGATIAGHNRHDGLHCSQFDKLTCRSFYVKDDDLSSIMSRSIRDLWMADLSGHRIFPAAVPTVEDLFLERNSLW